MAIHIYHFGIISARMKGEAHSEVIDVARGYLLIGVFYVHALYSISASAEDVGRFLLAGVQIKLLAPYVAAFFFLSGMSSPALGQKSARSLFRQSVMLLLLSVGSHLVAGILSQLLIFRKPMDEFLPSMIKPVIIGEGHLNFIGWFFVVLAFARIFAWMFERSRLWFLLVAMLTGCVMAFVQTLDLPDIYQWSTWPLAVLFMLCGIHIPRNVSIRWFIAVPSIFLSVALGWINREDIFGSRPCLSCDLEFAAQPSIGAYGFLPLYLLQLVLFIVGLLWISTRSQRLVTGRVGAYFGKRSLMMLILHGWIIVTLYPLAMAHLPPQGSIFFYITIISTVIVVHAGLFAVTSPLLRRFMALTSRASDLILHCASRVVALKRR